MANGATLAWYALVFWGTSPQVFCTFLVHSLSIFLTRATRHCLQCRLQVHQHGHGLNDREKLVTCHGRQGEQCKLDMKSLHQWAVQ